MPEGLRGARVLLRAERREDLAVLHADARNDPDQWMISSDRPWTPETLEAAQKRFDDGLGERPDPSIVAFTVEELAGGARGEKIVGGAVVYRIDLHHRTAMIGVDLLPAARGRGLGRDVVAVLCDYGFRIRALRRLALETMTDNVAMRRAAEAVGFVHEGTLRAAAWVGGPGHGDVALYGLLRDEWRP